MTYGLIDIQRSLDSSAEQGIRHAASLEKQRDQTNMELDQADDASRKSAIGQGAGMGASIGMVAGGPGGAVVGAGAGATIGYLTYEFLQAEQ